MELLEILAFIALIAVIFGVTMHEAFWGIVAFCALGFLASVVVLFIKAGATRIGNKIAYLKTPQGKAEQKKKAKSILNDIFEAFLVLCLFSPLIIGGAIALFFKDFSANYPIPTILIAVAPLATVIVSFLIATKKHTNK